METQKNSPTKLQECEEKLKHLEEENQHLRDASRAFGQLAERLNHTLQEERRSAEGDRRQRPRQNGERRKPRDSTLTLAPQTSNDDD
jgi:predicted RNase H-like nuclease (RuvC/YqgF family)